MYDTVKGSDWLGNLSLPFVSSLFLVKCFFLLFVALM